MGLFDQIKTLFQGTGSQPTNLKDALELFNPRSTSKRSDVEKGEICLQLIKEMQTVNGIGGDNKPDKFDFSEEDLDLVIEAVNRMEISKISRGKLISWIPEEIARKLLVQAAENVEGMTAEEAQAYCAGKLPEMVPKAWKEAAEAENAKTKDRKERVEAFVAKQLGDIEVDIKTDLENGDPNPTPDSTPKKPNKDSTPLPPH